MDIPDQTYKDHTIQMTRQAKTGINSQVYFRVLSPDGEHTAFVLWMTGAPRRGLTQEQMYGLLTDEGIKFAKDIIDRNEYQPEEEFKQTI